MANETQLTIYLFTAALAVFFSGNALNAKVNYKIAVYSWLAMCIWFALSIMHLLLTFDDLIIVYLVWLYLGLGIVFTIHGIAYTIYSLKDAAEKNRWRVLES